jgi:16S rRNA (adenine1518-N6/adenine1519-N6)-dimethyltransferase
MTGTSLEVVSLLKRYGLRPQKSLGQNFLVDDSALGRVVAAGQIQPGQTVLEIGPGLGSLTRLLAETAARVVCVELDSQLIPPLEQVLGAYPNVRIVQGDILKLDPARLIEEVPGTPPPDYLVVANIPYYITSALMRHLLETRCPPRRLVLTVQQEVAQRICAEAGEMSLLALSVQVYGQPQIAGRISAEAFYPPPKVDSAIIRVEIYREPLIPRELIAPFFRLAKAGFSQKRKTLRNSLAGGMHWSTREAGEILEKAGIDPMRRAETLSLDEWRTLLGKLEASAPEDHQHPSQEAQPGPQQ